MLYQITTGCLVSSISFHIVTPTLATCGKKYGMATSW